MAAEVRRRDEAVQLGHLMTGCQALDKDLMMGGFERGSVVGVSASRPGALGELMAIQMIAEFMKKECPDLDGVPPKVHVTSALAPGTFATALRGYMVKDLGNSLEGGPDAAKRMTRRYLECVIITQVVDIKDLVEVMCGRLSAEATTSAPAPSGVRSPKHRTEEVTQAQLSYSTRSRIETLVHGTGTNADNGKGGDGDSVPSSPDPLAGSFVSQTDSSATFMDDKEHLATSVGIEKAEAWTRRLEADLVIIHNIGALIMNEYNKSRSKDTFHANLKKLNSVLRSMVQCEGTVPPLVVLLNGTSTPWPPSGGDAPGAGTSSRTQFTFATNLRPQYEDFFHAIVDVSLLCTRVRLSHDAALTAEDDRKTGSQGWVVTVVKDEIGVWELITDLSPKERLDMGGVENRESRVCLVAIHEGRIQSSLITNRDRQDPALPDVGEFGRSQG